MPCRSHAGASRVLSRASGLLVWALMVVAARATAGEAPRLAHVANLTKSRHPRSLSKAEQTVRVNEWWCTQPGHNVSLNCRRHLMQRRFAATEQESERAAISQQLRDLLLYAGEPAIAALKEETRSMQHAFCQLSTNANLPLCRSRQRAAAASKGGSHSKQPNRKVAPSAAASSSGRAAAGGKRRGIAKLWTPEVLTVLRAWWCGERRHAREKLCNRGVRWTRKTPGLSAMRNQYCAQQRPADESEANIARLCLGPPTNRAKKGGGHMPNRGSPNPSGGPSGRKHRQHTSMAVKLLVGLCVLAGLIGWVIERRLHARRRLRVLRVARNVEEAEVAEEVQSEVVGDAAARRRQKRARVIVSYDS